MILLTFAAILLVAALAHRAGRAGDSAPGVMTRSLASHSMVALVFVVSFVVLWYSWAALHPIPVVHDEMAYVLQAQIFARGSWALPTPTLPGFWEQPYILQQPAVAAKYFPGHALLLAPGALVGWMPLVPLMLQSTSGALLYVLARRVSSGGVALLAWTSWLFSPMVLYFGPSYYSEATTAACWLGGWYALLSWRETRSASWLAAVGLAVSWCAITRPLTGFAYAIPVGVVVVHDVIRTHRWRQLAVATAVGAVVLGILPLWSARTTGDWRHAPLQVYTHEYMPYDVPGFGLDSTPPLHALTPELARLSATLMASHAGHVPASLPRELVARARYLFQSIWGVNGGVVGVFALLGMLALSRTTAFAVATGVWLVITYLSFATPATWTLYYYETVPAFAYLSAAGMAWAAALIGRPSRGAAALGNGWRSARYTHALVAGALVLAIPGLAALQLLHVQHIRDRHPLNRFGAVLASLPAREAVVFVRHAPDHDVHVTFVRNSADPERERVWVVYDLGDSMNAELMDLVPKRAAYLFDEAVGRIYPYDPHSTP